ncbi:MAG: DUF2339 domain-containing protein, partial [Planctomycetota bacterium]
GASMLWAIANFETLVGLVLIGTIVLHWWPIARSASGMRGLLGAVGLTVGIVLVSLDLWRLLDSMNISPVTRRAGVSICWAVIAVGLVVFGLRRRVAALRYYGLALIAVAATKVLVYDLATVSRGWRTISFIVVGLLMIGVSVAYATFGPRLLARHTDDQPQPTS